MANYRVALATGVLVSGTSSTKCVAAHAGVLALLKGTFPQGFAYLTNPTSDGVTFKGWQWANPSALNGGNTVTLPGTTLDHIAAGALCFISRGGDDGAWILGTVMLGASGGTIAGQENLPTTTQAAALVSDGTSQAPAVGTVVGQTGTSEAGTVWWQDKAGNFYETQALSTIGTLGNGPAFVNLPVGGWTWVNF